MTHLSYILFCLGVMGGLLIVVFIGMKVVDRHIRNFQAELERKRKQHFNQVYSKYLNSEGASDDT